MYFDEFSIQFGFDFKRCCWSHSKCSLRKLSAMNNHFPIDEQFNCSFGCENPNQCEYYNNLPANQVASQLQNYVENGNFYYGQGYDDGVVPSNHFESNNQPLPSYQSFPIQTVVPPMNNFYNQVVEPAVQHPVANYFTDHVQAYPPCQGPQPWNFAPCYGYYGEAPCQFANVVDMEDFM